MLVLAPLPNFMFCGLPQSEKQRRMQSFAFVFLLLSVFSNSLWSAYALKLENMDMLVPNAFGKFYSVFYNDWVLACIVSIILMVMYITVDCDVK